jgi:hypothetical protein
MKKLFSFSQLSLITIKRSILVLVFQIGLLPLFFSDVKAQVYNGNLSLNSQADVDAFNYTSVTGILFISSISSNITNLDHLSTLTSVGQNLLIDRQRFLENINGLSHLQSVAGIFSIDDCPSLKNIDGLSGLQSVQSFELGGQFDGNPHIKNINGLANLTTCHSIKIEDNDSLTNIDPLLHFSSFTGQLIVTNNAMLTNVDALSNVTTVAQELHVGGSHLSSINGLSNLTSVGDLTIGGILAIDAGAPLLTTLDPLANLATINGNLEIGRTGVTNLNAFTNISQVHFLILDGNDALTDIGGLGNITKIGGGLFVDGNFSLTDLAGLYKVTSIGGRLDINDNHSLTSLNGLSALNSVGFDITIDDNHSLTDFCGLYNLFHSGTINGSVEILRNGANTVSFGPVSIDGGDADPGKCSEVIAHPLSPTVNGCLVPVTVTHTPYPAGNAFPVGTTYITWTATDAANNTSTALQAIVVTDNQSPTITCPADVTVGCASDVPAVNINSVTASDNCSAVVTHVSDDTTNKTCANRFTLTRTYRATDPAGNYTDCSEVITVNDNTPPQITELNTSQTILWPANHTMRDVTVNYTATDNCVSNLNIAVTVTSNEPVNGTADGDTDPDWIVVDNHHIKLRAERAANGTGRIYTITVTISDGCNAPVSASTTVEVVHNITGPQSGRPFIVGSTVNLTGEFWDKPTNKHTAKWLIDGSTSVKGNVTEPTTNKNGKVTGSNKFTTPGVYKIQMNVIDQNNVTSYANMNGDIEEIIVIYDPNGGYTYGGGWFNSQAGALVSDPAAEGKASYGFTVNYFKGATNPRGETQFEFKVGSLEFNALNFDYLVIDGARAQFRGTGKITGDQSGYGFIMTVIDGDLGGSGMDRIRMKIYNKNTGRVVYDNQPGASDAVDPVEAVGDNSSVVIYNTNNLVTKVQPGTAEVSGKLEARAIPNPSNGNFAITVQSNDIKSEIRLQVMDMSGRIVEERTVIPNSTTRIGDNYSSGVYNVTISQDKTQKQIKLVKTSGMIY